MPIKLSTLIGAGVLGLATISQAQRKDGQYWPCNPLTNKTACPPNLGLATSTYTLDFTTVNAEPDRWTASNYATITYGSNGGKGAAFTIGKNGDAPQLWTDFYILFGRVDVEMQCSNGQGIISSSVIISDDFDEIDWEWSGNNFGNPAFAKGQVQNNYFGKGITGAYDRGMFVNVAAPQTTFHTYSVDWTPDRLVWSIDGKAVRTLRASDTKDNEHQYPQTPSKIQLGSWAGGAPGMGQGTVSWAGGNTDFTKGPFNMYVRKVTITNANSAPYYNYTDHSGKWTSIKKLQSLPNAQVSSSVSQAQTAKPSTTTHPAAASTGAASSGASSDKAASSGAAGSSAGGEEGASSSAGGAAGGAAPKPSSGAGGAAGSSAGTDKGASSTGGNAGGGAAPKPSGGSGGSGGAGSAGGTGETDGAGDTEDDSEGDSEGDAAPGGSGSESGGGASGGSGSGSGTGAGGKPEAGQVPGSYGGGNPDAGSSSSSKPGVTAPTTPLTSSAGVPKPTGGGGAKPEKPKPPPSHIGYSIWNLWGAGAGGNNRLARLYRQWSGRVEDMGGWNHYLRKEGGIVGVVRDVEGGFVRGGW